jgi:uncharacterized hydrophobic protein (TIGR00341 family)
MSLRIIEAVVPDGLVEELARKAEEWSLIDFWREELPGGLDRLKILVKSDKADSVIAHLETKSHTTPKFRLVIYEVEATIPAPRQEEKQGAEPGEEEKPKDPQRIAVAELVQKLTENAHVDSTYLITVLLATIVAAIGLLRDNVAVIIGAMVIAPLLGPNMSLALATTLGDRKVAGKAARVALAGVVLALAISMVIGAMVEIDPGRPEIFSRTVVSLSDVVLALAAGCAGGLSFTTGISASLVGVMVSVALLPPLVVLGFMLGSAEWVLAGNAGLLFAANVICVNIAAVATFLWKGIRPRYWWETRRAQKMVRLAMFVWVVLLLVLIAVIYFSSR